MNSSAFGPRLVAGVLLASTSCLATAAVQSAHAPRRVELILDGSLSMAGYARAGNIDRRPLGDTIAMAQEYATSQNAQLNAKAFGAKFKNITGDLELWGTPAPYECKSKVGCDNLESRIDIALKAVRSAEPSTLSIVVSDLWLDNKAFSGTAAVALGQPLTAVLESGRTVAIVGIRAPFGGVVYDFPGVGNYKAAKERALFLIVAGPSERVTSFIAKLDASGSGSFAGMQRTLFRLQRAPVQISAPKALGAGVKKESGSPARYEFDWPQASRTNAPGRIALVVDLERLLPATTVWRGPLAYSTKLTRLTGGQWTNFPLSKPTWIKGNKPYEAIFAFGPSVVGQLPAGDYRLTGQLGTAAIASPEKSAQWMREWSLSPNPGKPAFVGGMGIATLAKILEQAVNRPTAVATFSVEIEIED